MVRGSRNRPHRNGTEVKKCKSRQEKQERLWKKKRRERNKLEKEEHQKANAARAKAAKEVKRAIFAKREIEKWRREGLQPIVTPTVEELEGAKRRVRHKEGPFISPLLVFQSPGAASLP